MGAACEALAPVAGGSAAGRSGETAARLAALLGAGRVGLLEAPSVRRAASLLAALAAAAGRRTLVQEAGGGFDPYAVARHARAWGLDPRPLLERIRIARAFTCHQARALASRRTGAEAIVLAGGAATFLDEDVPDREAAILFRRFVDELAHLRGRGVTLLIAQPVVACPRLRRFLPILRAAADLRLAIDPDRRLLHVAVAGDPTAVAALPTGS